MRTRVVGVVEQEGRDIDGPAGGSRHRPVMLAEVLERLDPVPGGTYIDGTLGGGGHAIALARRLGATGTLLGIDRDPTALQRAGARLADWPGRLHLARGDFRDLPALAREAGLEPPHGILLDLGPSSDQLEDPARGFGYADLETLLDMRMDPAAGLTAADILAEWPEGRLREILASYGEERWAARIARFICERRRRRPLRTAGELVDVVKSAIPAGARRRGGHPARRTFQALRIAVNAELEGLEEAVETAALLLRPGGRMVVISFHSLEDRPVKRAFARLARSCRCPVELPVCRCEGVPLVRLLPALQAAEAELEQNPRARSARLRAVERLERLAAGGSGLGRG